MPTVQQALDRIWSDQSLKQQLLSDPKAVLQGFGLTIPESISVQVHENTPTIFNAVLPAKPTDKVSLPDGDPVSRIIERAWNAPGFKSRLLANPNEAAEDMGVRIPTGVTLRIWENTAAVEHLVLPLDPAQSELSDMDLEAVAGGSSSKGGPKNPCAAAATGVQAVTGGVVPVAGIILNVGPATSGLSTGGKG